MKSIWGYVGENDHFIDSKLARCDFTYILSGSKILKFPQCAGDDFFFTKKVPIFMFFPFFSARREREQERRTAQNEFLRQSLRNSQKLRALKGT